MKALYSKQYPYPGRPASAVLVAILLLCFQVNAQTTDFSAIPLTDDIWQITGPSGNTLVAKDTDGLILVDGVPVEYADQYLGFIKSLTNESRIKAIINSHWHDEVTGLNAKLVEQTAQSIDIIAQANTRQWLGATIRKRGEEIIHTPVERAFLPNRTFYTELQLEFRDSSIQLGHLLQAHTDGDLYVYFPSEKILYTGAAIRTDSWSTVDETTNGFIGGLMDAYDTLAQLIDEETLIVPASGKAISKAGFDEQMVMYKGLMSEMVALLRQSRSAEEVVIANPAIGLMPQWGDPAEFLDQGFRSFYGHLRNGKHVGTMP